MIFLTTLPLACGAPCSLASLPQDHGDFHSPEAQLVLRIPSLAGIEEAAVKSAAGHVLADPEFEAWIRVITGQADFEAPKTIQEAYGLTRSERPAAEWSSLPEWLWSDRARGISASLATNEGSMEDAFIGLGTALPGAARRSIMEDLYLQWAIEFPTGEDRDAWLADAVKQFDSREDCTLAREQAGSPTYRWAVGDDLMAGAEPVQEGTLRLAGQLSAVIGAGNPTHAGAAPTGSPHPLFPQGQTGDDVTAALGMTATALGSLPWESPETAPLAELLAACMGPMAEAVSLSGRLEWTGGDRSATLRCSRERNARKAVGAVPLSEGALSLAHPEAHIAVVTGLDMDAFARSFRSLGAAEELIALFSEAMPEIGISVLPMSRGVLPQLLVAFHQQDRATTILALDAACDQIAESTRREIMFARADYRGAYYVTLRFKSPGMLETLVQPCIVVTEDRIFLASDTALAKREIRRLGAETARRVHAGLTGMNAPKTGVTLAACADWAGLLTDVHGRANGLVKALGPMILGPMDPGVIPSQGLLTRHLTPSSRWVALSDAGFTEEARTPFGPCEFGLAATLMVSWFTVELDHQIAASKVARTNAELAAIHSSLQQYYLQEAAWPDRLSDLPLVATAPRDPWGSLYRYSIGQANEVQLRSIGANLMDEDGSGDDIVLRVR